MNTATPLPLFETNMDRRFAEFHLANPEVYETLRRLALHAARRNRPVGIRCLWERARWELFVEVEQKDGEYRLNDHLTSRYARLLMEREPELRQFFEVRELRS